MSFADLVIQKGPIITVNQRRGIVDAVAVLNGKLIAVGNKPKVKRLIEPMTEVVDLDGRERAQNHLAPITRKRI